MEATIKVVVIHYVVNALVSGDRLKFSIFKVIGISLKMNQ
jgi:hypothetical protein